MKNIICIKLNSGIEVVGVVEKSTSKFIKISEPVTITRMKTDEGTCYAFEEYSICKNNHTFLTSGLLSFSDPDSTLLELYDSWINRYDDEDDFIDSTFH